MQLDLVQYITNHNKAPKLRVSRNIGRNRFQFNDYQE